MQSAACKGASQIQAGAKCARKGYEATTDGGATCGKRHGDAGTGPHAVVWATPHVLCPGGPRLTRTPRCMIQRSLLLHHPKPLLDPTDIQSGHARNAGCFVRADAAPNAAPDNSWVHEAGRDADASVKSVTGCWVLMPCHSCGALA